MECPESIEELEKMAEKIQPKKIETKDYIYIPISRKRIPFLICPKKAKSAPIEEQVQTEQVSNDFNTYFINDGNFVKIGKAKNVLTRLKDLQIGNPHLLVIDIIIFMDVEKELHSYFSHCKELNEWFKLPQNYEESVIKLCKEQGWKVGVIE